MRPCVAKALAPPIFQFHSGGSIVLDKTHSDHMLPAIKGITAITAPKNVANVGGTRCNLFLKDQHFHFLSLAL